MMHDHLVSNLYEAASGEESWDSVVDSLRKYIGADIMILGSGDPRTPSALEAWTSGWEYFGLDQYGYGIKDLWNPSINPSIPAALVMPTEKAEHHRRFVPDAVLASSEFQQRVYDLGFSNHLIAVPTREKNQLSGMFAAKLGHADFDAEEMARLNAIMPHVGRSMSIRNRLARHKSVEDGLARLLDQMGEAVFLVDRDRRLLFLNAQGENLAAGRSPVTVRRQILSLGREGDGYLAQIFRQIDAFEACVDCPSSFVLNAGEQGQLTVRCSPAVGMSEVPGTNLVFAMIRVEMPERPSTVPGDTTLLALMSSLGLTPAEAAVAQHVPSGETRRAIGEALGLSENTVKTHLSSIRAKTGARNQVDLAQLIQRIVPRPLPSSAR